MSLSDVYFTLTVALLCQRTGCFSISGETSLREDLLTNYSTHVRPSDVTNVQIAFNILSVQEMNLRGQQISFAGWFTLVWSDHRLSWSPASYHSVDSIHTDDDDIWYPVLVVDNSVDDMSPIEDDSIPMRVLSDGSVNWSPPAIISTTCDMDPTYFPFDKHACSIQVTSFGYTLSELNLTVKGDGMVTSFYQQHGEWQLLSHAADATDFQHDGHSYARVHLYIKLKRRPSYHGINLILPVVINSILVPFVFKLSTESGEKIGFTLTLLLSYMVVLTLLESSMPSTSLYTSVLEVYMSTVLVVSTCVSTLTVFIQTFSSRPDSRPVPGWMHALVVCMARCLCWKADRSRIRPESKINLAKNSDSDKTTETPVGWTDSMSSNVIFTWKDATLIMDEFFFILFLTIIVVLIVVVLALLGFQY